MKTDGDYPNSVSAGLQPKQIERFRENCKLVAPLGFLRGFRPRFRVHLLRYSSFFLNVWLLWLVFFEVIFHSDCIRQENTVLMHTGVRLFGRAQTKSSSQSRQFAVSIIRNRSFVVVLILDSDWPVW